MLPARGAKAGRINQTRAARTKSPDPTHLHSVDLSFTGHRYAKRGARRQEHPTKTDALGRKVMSSETENGMKW
jgi:hypothetical protein